MEAGKRKIKKSAAGEERSLQLSELSAFIETQPNIEENLRELAIMAAGILNFENCSIMLLKDEEDNPDPVLRVFAHSGFLPSVAHQVARNIKEGISGHVVTTGEPLFVTDIDRSPFAPLKRGRYSSRGFIAAPLSVEKKVVGVINANTPRGKTNVAKKDLELLTIIALLISKSLQLIQLQHVLKSKYVQFALSREIDMTDQHSSLSVSQSPGKIAKVLARTFYREMTRVGFGPDHMITTATEILSLLSEKLEKHRGRRERS